MGIGIQAVVMFELLLQEDTDVLYFCHDCDSCVDVQDILKIPKKGVRQLNCSH